MSANTGTGVVPRRRNGKQQACEPCRKAKISCDHSLPVCNRCKRKNAPSKCIYLAAPMTRRSTSSPGLANTNDTEINCGTLSSTNSNVHSNAKPANDQVQSSECKPSVEIGRIQSGGFFGPTNFSAVFIENSDNIGNDIPISNDSDILTSYDSLQSQNFLMLPSNEFRGSPRIALGVRVLRQLPNESTCNFLLQQYSRTNSQCVPPSQAIDSMATSFWSMWGKALKGPRHSEVLEQISAHLCKNSESPLQEEDDYQPWIKSMIGTNLRWEVIGLIFATQCHGILSLQERDAFFTTQVGQRKDRQHFALELKDCVQACVTLSNYMDYINIVMVSLLSKNLVLGTIMNGDTSLVVWRQLGDLVSTSTALGLHRQPDNGGQVTYLSEFKKRLFVIIFIIDKGSSHLTGRPPVLSCRYSYFRLPLDIDDETLTSPPDILAASVAKLDANGWNKTGSFETVTWSRAMGYLALDINEILDLSLGDPNDITSERITSLMSRLQQTYDNLPAFLHYSQSDAHNPRISDDMLWRRLCLHLSFLEQRITLERLAHKFQMLNGQSMIDCALEMLQLTVLIWVQRDRFIEHHQDYDWMLMCWGIPSSGVLCVEVLKQLKSPSESAGLRILKSEIVQNLSLFVGFLEWIRPGAGNYQLCRRMSRLVKRILDQILNHNAGSTQQSGETVVVGYEHDGIEGGDAGNANANGMVGVEMDGLGSDDFGAFGNLDWLNELDWSRGPWMNLDGLT